MNKVFGAGVASLGILISIHHSIWLFQVVSLSFFNLSISPEFISLASAHSWRTRRRQNELGALSLDPPPANWSFGSLGLVDRVHPLLYVVELLLQNQKITKLIQRPSFSIDFLRIPTRELGSNKNSFDYFLGFLNVQTSQKRRAHVVHFQLHRITENNERLFESKCNFLGLNGETLSHNHLDWVYFDSLNEAVRRTSWLTPTSSRS